MNEFQDDPEVDELFRAVLDQNLTVTQVRRLEEILLSDPKAREDYLRLTEIDHFLQVCYHGEDALSMLHRQEPAGKTIRTFWMTWAVVCVASVCLLGVFFQPGQENENLPVAEARMAAILTRSIDAVWGKHSDTRHLPDGSQWNVGDWIELKKGTALLTFANGVECAITGEVQMKMDDELNCFLVQGIGTFDVPENAKGFTVHTHGGAFVDMGTSFGVTVSDQGNSEVHVLKGVVNAQAGKAEAEKHMSLISGKAAKLNPASKTLSATAFRPETFSKPLAFLAGVERLPRTWSFWSQPIASIVPKGELRRPESIWLCKEQSQVVLAQELIITSTYGNTDTPANHRDIRLPAGTQLGSYLMHFSHDVLPSKPRVLSGSITFRSPVVALIRSADELSQTDSMFCFKQTDLGIEQSISLRRGSNESEDYAQIVGSDNRTVQFQLSTAGAPSLDQVRILVLHGKR